jgi:hypothetical protein
MRLVEKFVWHVSITLKKVISYFAISKLAKSATLNMKI